MKKTLKKKLTLQKETVSSLDVSQMGVVNGGAQPLPPTYDVKCWTEINCETLAVYLTCGPCSYATCQSSGYITCPEP